jgi:AraC-like DNA-binding protein
LITANTHVPAKKLAPFVRRHYVISADIPDSVEIEDYIIAETAFIRILLDGHYTVTPKDGAPQKVDKISFFGPNAYPLRGKISGKVRMVACAIRPSAWRALFSQPAHDYMDAVLPLSDLWGEERAEKLYQEVAAAKSDEDIVAAIESTLNAQIKDIGRMEIDEKMSIFEKIARTDSTARVEKISKELGMSTRQMERRSLSTFGLTPKAVLRRSRLLDMAAAMRGFMTPEQAKDAKSRFFDESHLNREFHRYTNMTPGAFNKSVTPLFSVTLQMREAGKKI